MDGRPDLKLISKFVDQKKEAPPIRRHKILVHKSTYSHIELTLNFSRKFGEELELILHKKIKK